LVPRGLPDACESGCAMTLTPEQQGALDLIDRAATDTYLPFAVICGYAGTGKTTLLEEAKVWNPLLLAPTGKAALRLKTRTGLRAQTIHRAIKVFEEERDGKPQFGDKEEVDLPSGCGVIIVDEASMITEDLWDDLCGWSSSLGVGLVAVGDGFQLPPVSDQPFSVFDLATPNRVDLTHVHRQGEGSPVLLASMEIRAANVAPALRRFQQVRASGWAAVANETFNRGGVTICYRNETRHALNAAVREARGISGASPTAGEPLLVTRNNYDLDLFNGEVVAFDHWIEQPAKVVAGGAILNVGTARLLDSRDPASPRRVTARICLEGLTGRAIPESMRRGLLRTEFGYVMTAHKAQGSEWPEAFVILERGLRMGSEDGRRWLYTAITRAKTSVRIGVQ
jgi:exodeoxyribonuclease-5